MKSRKLFREIETSNEPVKTSYYVRYLSLQGYDPGMQYDAHAQALTRSYLKIFTPILMMTACLMLIKEIQYSVMIVVTLPVMMVYALFGLCNKWNVITAYGSKEKVFRKLQMYRWISKVEYQRQFMSHS